MEIRDDDRSVRFEREIIPEIPVLLAVATSLSPQSADAHDLVQETLTRAWRSFDTFDGEYPRAWLLTILRNASRDRFRKPQPITLDLSEPGADNGPDSAPSAEDELIDRRLDGCVGAAVRSLKPEAQQLIVLVDVDGLSYREASALLGIPEGTVMSRLHRARSKVRKQVERARKAGDLA